MIQVVLGFLRITRLTIMKSYLLLTTPLRSILV
uniref:Uncharacterized protein n=1 Tax=Arundo donax TaxID=35708 RepID=A0A0A9C5Z4_ARUDO